MEEIECIRADCVGPSNEKGKGAFVIYNGKSPDLDWCIQNNTTNAINAQIAFFHTQKVTNKPNINKMSYNNDELARQAQAALNTLAASNSSQPQNPTPYQPVSSSNTDESPIYTPAVVPMNLLNSHSSHSTHPLANNPAPQRMSFQNPNRQGDLRRDVLERQAYNQGQQSREPLGVGFSAQPPNYYAQAPSYPGPGPSGSQLGTQSHGPISASVIPQGAMDPANLKQKAKREEKISQGICPHDQNPLAPGKKRCESCLEAERKSLAARRQELIDRGICYGCRNKPGVAHGKKCQTCIDDAAAYYQSRK